MSHPIRVLIADDEPAARRTIQLLLAGDSDFQVLGECSDGLQTVDAILRLHPDLVFLDVQMPRRDGFEVLARLPPASVPLIVFVTAFDEYTLRAFDVHAADYLLKPFSDNRFRAAVAHVKERLRQRSAARSRAAAGIRAGAGRAGQLTGWLAGGTSGHPGSDRHSHRPGCADVGAGRHRVD